ncbi:MAG: murein biosynthesis integral membrane protein MurJ [Desulfobacteraceae bacterium]|nr:murein biosynthesis integral membrane protein MurJ [Pseudomonadota bacterium]MCG2754000.1 murein biosynthesis integral membrane protein MurJ [Desulfobacteraceae bacterium]
MSENTRVTKAAGVVGAATLLSRLFGFIRDVVIAWFFGAGLSSDAFFVAFRIPNLLRRLFAEGSLSIAFIPVFTEYLTIKGRDEAFKLARAAIWLLSMILAIVAVLGVLLSPVIIKVIAPGFISSPEKFFLTVNLTRIMFPYIFFIGLVALCMGILNSLGHFAAPALAPVFLNIAMICSVFFISPYMSDPVTGLAIGVLIGGVLQLALQIPFLIKKGLYFLQRVKIFHPGLKRIGLLMLPAVFGAAVYQINILVSTLLASLLPEGSVSYLYYADRLVQFPLGIFAIATATAILPSLSRQASSGDLGAVKDTFAHAMKLVLFITIPSMVGLIILREPIVALLFKRGVFDSKATQLTAYALLYYGIGLWAFSGVRIVVSTFYALQDTRTPVRMAVISIIANIVLGIILMGPLAHGGLALATSLASMLNFGLLIRALKIKLGSLGLRSIAESACKSVLCAAIMGAVVMVVSIFMIPSAEGSLHSLFFGLIGTIIIGFLFYGSFSFLIKSPEMEKLWGIIVKGIRKS